MRAMSHSPGCALPLAGRGSGMLVATAAADGGLPRWMLSAIGLVAVGSRKAGLLPSVPSACMGGGRTALSGPAPPARLLRGYLCAMHGHAGALGQGHGNLLGGCPSSGRVFCSTG